MREIKFRGYNKNYGWVYGSLNNCNQNEIIISCFDESLPFNSKIVLTESIGQFTGLKDKNGNDIYEGDIVSFVTESNCFDGLPKLTVRIGSVYWMEFRSVFAIQINKFMNQDLYKFIQYNNVVEVVGNIHENPELLAVPAAVL